MRRGKEVIGKKIVSLTGDILVDHVRDLIFDPAGQRLLGLLVDEGGWFHAARVIPFDAVSSFGEDAVMVADSSATVSAREVPGLSEVLSSDHKLVGTALISTEGDDLGRLADLYFDEQSGQVAGYDVSGGVFADLSSGRSFVPAFSDLHLGKDVALVPPEIARQMEEQAPGGLQGVAQQVSDSVKERAGQLADATKAQQRTFVEGKPAASDVLKPDGTPLVRKGETISAAQATEAEELGVLGTLTAAAGGGTVQHLYGTARDGVQSGYEHLATASKEQQQTFVVGKTAGRDVVAQDGFQVIRQGEIVTEWHATSADTHGAFPALLASATSGALQQSAATVQERLNPGSSAMTVEDALGRRVQSDVRGPAGTLIAPTGQIVTRPVIDRAKSLNRERELMAAVQLGAPVTQRLAQQGTNVGSQLSAGAQNVKEGATGLIEQARNWLSQTGEKASDAAEEHRIEGAIGRPVNRVVLDRQDTIILNIGEIITHKAVEQARQGEVLGILLNSVSTETPSIDPLSVGPDERGQAALDSQPELKKDSR